VEDFFKAMVEKLREIAANGKDAGDLRSMITEYANDLELMSSDSDPIEIEINEDEEAAFIQNYLLIQGSGFIATDDIKHIVNGQLEYLVSVGLAEPNNEHEHS
jgi:hypothetical protein